MNLSKSSRLVIIFFFVTLVVTASHAQTNASASISISGAERSTYCFPCVGQTAWDTGIVAVSVNGYVQSVSYGNGTTSAGIAQLLAYSFSADPSSPVSGTASGSSLTLTAKALGQGGNYYSIATTSYTTNTNWFSGSSFFANAYSFSGGSVPRSGSYTTDCVNSIPAGYTRVQINPGDDFDTKVLTQIPGGKPLSNVIVCIAAGLFRTNGTYDWVSGKAGTLGFAVGMNWRIHGAGVGQTTVQLAKLFPGGNGTPAGGTVFSTFSDASDGVEISDLTIDDNYPQLKTNATPINLQAIALRSDGGGHWVHNVNVINSAGEVQEAFPVQIVSVNRWKPPSQNNTIEYVTLSSWRGGKCTAIVMVNASGVVRYNVVDGYQQGYGGWVMSSAWFHDNIANKTGAGFLIDSEANAGVLITSNQIINPSNSGIVIGGSSQKTSFQIQFNTIDLGTNSTLALKFQGDVTNTLVANNNFVTGLATPQGLAGIVLSGQGNAGNVYQNNQISDYLANSQIDVTQNCIFGNTGGNPPLPNTQGSACPTVPVTLSQPFLSANYDVGAGNLKVNYLGAQMDGGEPHVWQLTGNNSTNTWAQGNDLSRDAQAPDSSAAAIASMLARDYDQFFNNVEIYYIGADSHIHQLFSDSTGGWHTQDLTSATSAVNAATASPLVSLYDSIANSIDVYFLGSDQHIHELWWSGKWYTVDVTTSAGAGSASVGSSITAIVNNQAHTLEVDYVGANQHIYELWWNGTWHTNDLTGITSAPLPDPGSPLASVFDQVANQDELYYVGADRHVHQLWFYGNWHTTDISLAVGALNAGPRAGLTALANTIGNSLEVDYVATDQHVHQLWYGAGAWHQNDLTAMSGAPVAGIGTALVSLIDPGASHSEIYFFVGERHVYELWYNGNGHWYGTDVSALSELSQ
jgi:hypothetical protein